MTSPNEKLLYEGKAKKVFEGPTRDQVVMYFKDSATAFNAKKKGEFEKKGTLNQKIAAHIFEYLESNGVQTHYIKSLSDREMLVKAVKIVPLEVVVRNLAAGSLCKRYGIAEKLPISPPLVEFFLKNDALDDPLLNEDHIRILKAATDAEISDIKKKALRINELLRAFFDRIGITLADFKLEFGKTQDGTMVLADEITPDGCRLWDKETQNILDKDRFRKDLGGFMEAYELVWDRITKGHA